VAHVWHMSGLAHVWSGSWLALLHSTNNPSPQFQRLANIYFLFISLLMMIGTYTTLFDSPLTPWSTLGPLSMVMTFSLIKEGLEDVKRHKSDRQINNTRTEILDITASATTAVFKEVLWRNVQVGDIVKVKNNHDIPADLALLYSTEEESAS